MIKTGYVYVIVNRINGKSYVGQTTRCPNRRWREHIFQRARSVSVLRKAVEKYGSENFTLRVIGTAECVDGLDRLNQLEIHFIKRFNSSVPNGYNLDGGGKNKNTHPETRLRLSISHKGKIPTPEARAKASASHTGRKHGPMSEEQKALLSELNKGKKLPPQLVEKIRERMKGNKYSLGYRHTPETRARMSVSQKLRKPTYGRKLSPEHKEALTSSWRGRRHSEESKKKISLANKGRVHSVQSRRNMGLGQTGRKQSPVTRMLRSLALQGNKNAARKNKIVEVICNNT